MIVASMTSRSQLCPARLSQCCLGRGDVPVDVALTVNWGVAYVDMLTVTDVGKMMVGH